MTEPCKANMEQCMERFDRLEKKIWHGDGEEPMMVQVAMLKERAAAIEKLRVEAAIGRRAFWLASVSFLLTILGWLVLFVRDWNK